MPTSVCPVAEFDYARAKATADRLIARFGQAATLRQTTHSGSPTNPVGSVIETSAPITLVVLPIDATQTGQDVGETTIRTTDSRIYAAVADMTPETGDRLETANGTFVVLRCNVLAPAGSAVMYDIVGRL